MSQAEQQSLLKQRGISQSDATKGFPSRRSNTQIYMIFAWYKMGPCQL